MRKFFYTILIIACIASCSKEGTEDKHIDTQVETHSATDIIDVEATCWGRIIEKGTAGISEYGIEITRPGGTSMIPYTILKADSFGVLLNDLEQGREYTYRAYAVENSNATRYGEYKTFTTLVPADLYISCSDITAESVVVEFTGTEQLREWGFYWKEGAGATTSDTRIDAKGEPKVTLEGLKPFTAYYILAYATDKNGFEHLANERFQSGYALPQLTTPVLSEITVSGASAFFEIAAIGGGTIAECGIQYSADGNKWTKKAATYVEGTITATLAGLNPAAKYFVQSYAKNSGGKETYSETVELTTAGSVPTLAKPTVTALVSYKVNMAGGEVTDDGQLTVTEYGFCWSTENGKAEAAGSNYVKITAGSKDAFEYLSYDLLAGATYYVRAYAKNEVGIGYSEEVTVTTPVIVYGSVQDIWDKSTTYRTVEIGNQIWMAEDLRNNGDGTTIFTPSNITSHRTSVCPADWHLPTKAEWNELITEAGERYIASKTLRNKNEAYSYGTNSTGFSAIPRTNDYNMYYTFDIWYHEGYPMDVYGVYMSGKSGVYVCESASYWQGSVRCIKDK